MYRRQAVKNTTCLAGLGLIGLVSLQVACGGPAPSSAPGTAEPVPARAVVERDGVRVTLTIDRQRVEVGGRVNARVEVVNFQPGIVFWQGGGCDLKGAFHLTGPDQGPEARGRAWPGDLGILKSVSLFGGLGGFVPPEALVQGRPMLSCPADLRVNELASAETVSAEAIWTTSHVNGLPAVPGPYVVSVSFPFLARQNAGPFPGDPLADRRPIDVQLPFVVEGSPVVAISQGQAIDAALGHGPFAAWLTDVPRARWNEGRMDYANGAWVFTLRVGGPEERAIVTIDATSGAVRDFQVLQGP